jgi:hypothetical protein
MIVITIALSFLIIVISVLWMWVGLGGRHAGECRCGNPETCTGGRKKGEFP